MDKMLTAQQACDALQCSLWWLRDQLKKGEIKGCKVGRAWRIKEKDLEAYLKSCEKTSTPARRGLRVV